jgi:two-component system phosphate regulon sensor histidine kinase PhoR
MILTIDLLKKTPRENPKKFQSLLETLENGIRKMQNLIYELTEIRKQEHKYKAEEELLNFEHILEDVRLTIAENILESGAVIKSEINASEITFSRRKLRSIIFNLVSNAIKFKSPDRRPEIFIKTELEDDFIILSVKDRGIGIDPSEQDAIFSKYFRMKNEIEGSGIGLYLVKEIVNNSGGKILLESQPGVGSEFKVYLKAKRCHK